MKEKELIRDGRAPIPKNAAISKVMRGNKAKDTRPELKVRAALWALGIKGYRLHWRKVPGRPDIAYPSKKVAIFVNGCYWHKCPHCKPHFPQTNTNFWRNKFAANAERDQRKNEQLTQLGWRVITLWECQVNKDLEQQLEAIFKAYYA